MSDLSPSPRQPAHEAVITLGRRFREAARARREADLACSSALAGLETLEGGAGWAYYGCASAGEFGERHGIAAEDARGLLDLGLACRRDPLFEQQVREGRIPVASACAVARVLKDAALQRPEDDWLGWAQTETVRQLRRRARRRIEEARAGGAPVVPVQVFVRQQARDDFDRARQIASDKAGHALTHGETFEVVVNHYLDTFDFDRVAPGKRRVPDTAFVAGRYVPMAVRREIYERQGRKCAVPFCDHAFFLEKAHLVAHALGGSREADNLILLCSAHHLLLDWNLMTMDGTAGQPVFRDAAGRDLALRLLAPPGDGSPPGGPPNDAASGEAGDGRTPGTNGTEGGDDSAGRVCERRVALLATGPPHGPSP